MLRLRLNFVMRDDQPPPFDPARQLEPFFPLFRSIFAAAGRQVKLAETVLGMSHKTERANDWHRAVRSNLQRAVDAADSPVLELTDGADGDGLDFLAVDLGRPIALRWGHFGSDRRIRRNDTERTRLWQQQVLDFARDAADVEAALGLTKYSLAYALADDYVEVGEPKWWLSRLLLVQELKCGCNVMAEVARYAHPSVENAGEPPMPRLPNLHERRREEEQWAEMIRRAG